MTIDDVIALLQRNFHCVVASSSAGGEPWASPVFFNYGPDLRIVFESAHTSRHATLIAANPRVAIAVADFSHRGRPRGVYLEAQAREVPPDGLAGALDLFLNGPHRKKLERSVADYASGKPLRLYEAIPHALYGLTQVKLDGYVIDQRVEVPLPSRKR